MNSNGISFGKVYIKDKEEGPTGQKSIVGAEESVVRRISALEVEVELSATALLYPANNKERWNIISLLDMLIMNNI